MDRRSIAGAIGSLTLDAKAKSTAGTGAVTAIVGGWITLSELQSIIGIVAAVVGTVATVVTLVLNVRLHKKRMRD